MSGDVVPLTAIVADFPGCVRLGNVEKRRTLAPGTSDDADETSASQQAAGASETLTITSARMPRIESNPPEIRPRPPDAPCATSTPSVVRPRPVLPLRTRLTTALRRLTGNPP